MTIDSQFFDNRTADALFDAAIQVVGGDDFVVEMKEGSIRLKVKR